MTRFPFVRILIALFLTLGTTSCASIITGSTDTVKILSEPSGANYQTNQGHSGVTPAEVSVPDGVDLEVRCWAPGYAESVTVVESRMSGWLFGNILIGGLIGIDLITGNYKPHDGEVTITLSPVRA